MEYIRKQRWANYLNFKCKEYLRNDFSHECAYCRLQEQEVGVVALEFFEIDHFRPQSLNLADTHEYYNLYYCCQKCNREKSDIWNENLLDPCADDIFSGNHPAITGGTKEYQYKYIANNDKGKFYIDTFKLNSRRQISFRKEREEHQNKIHTINTLIDQILSKVEHNRESYDLDLISLLEELRCLKQRELNKLPKDEIFEKVEKYLNDRNIENSLIFEEYNMDIKIKINQDMYRCELLVDNSTEEKTEYRKNISMEKLITWFKNLTSNFGILLYYPQINRMFFYPVSKKIKLSEISTQKRLKQIKINTNHLII